MTARTDTALSTLASTVATETVHGANTAARVGGLFGDLVDSKYNAATISPI
jgi:hypothetical protein